MIKIFKSYWNRYFWRIKNQHNYTWAVSIIPFDKVTVGSYSYGPLKVISYKYGDCNLKIGNFCSIAREVKFILGGEHDLNQVSTYPFETYLDGETPNTKNKGDIIIGDDVWFGYGAMILSGVTIGQGAVIGAGSVVCDDVPPYAVVGGVPARFIKYRVDEVLIPELLKIDYSKISRENYPMYKELLLSTEITKDRIRNFVNKADEKADTQSNDS